MSEENLQPGENKRDLMDGGFAVVDREKIIEEETRVITPWYMHFINVFFSPRKMMEENFYNDPPKGISVAIVGSVLFTIISVILSYANPIKKQQSYDIYRGQGIAEETLGQKYTMEQLIMVIGAVIVIFAAALLTATVIQIAKAIIKDKGRFGSLYTVVLFSTMVSSAIMCIDRLIALFIPTSQMVLGALALFPEEMMLTNPQLYIILQYPSLQFIASLIILIIGYSVVTRTSVKKATTVIISVEVFFALLSVGFSYLMIMMVQNALGTM